MRPVSVALVATLFLLGTGCGWFTGSKTTTQAPGEAAPVAPAVEKKAAPAVDTGIDGEGEGEDVED